ncbi:MAG: PAS domain-containing protein, partial [Pseudomonadota bacterium]
MRAKGAIVRAMDDGPDKTGGADDGAVLDALLGATVDGVIVSDARGCILRVNRAAAQLFRYRPED